METCSLTCSWEANGSPPKIDLPRSTFHSVPRVREAKRFWLREERSFLSKGLLINNEMIAWNAPFAAFLPPSLSSDHFNSDWLSVLAGLDWYTGQIAIASQGSIYHSGTSSLPYFTYSISYIFLRYLLKWPAHSESLYPIPIFINLK